MFDVGGAEDLIMGEQDSPLHLRAMQQDADVKCGAVALAFARGDIDESALWFWIAAYQRQWTDATRRLAGLGVA